MFKYLVLVAFLSLPAMAASKWFRSLSVGSNASDASSIFDVNSTTKGAIASPKMTTAQRDAISAPVEGLTIYNTTTSALNFYNGSAWAAVDAGGTTDLNVVSKTTTYTAAYNDFVNADTSGGAFTITLPAAASNSGKKIIVKLGTGGNNLTIDGNASETIDGDTTIDLTAKGTILTLVSDGTNFLIESHARNHYLATVNTSGTITATIQPRPFIASFTDNGTGDTSVNFTSGIFSETPICVGLSANASTIIQSVSAAGVQVRMFTGAGAGIDGDFYIDCSGR